MTRVNSRQKGKRGEREAVKFLRSLGFTASRTAQHCGKNGTADVIVEELPSVHIEVKYNVQGMDLGTKLLDEAREQAERDARSYGPIGSWKVPALLWKPMFKSWRLDFLDSTWLTVTTDLWVRHRLIYLQARGEDASKYWSQEKSDNSL